MKNVEDIYILSPEQRDLLAQASDARELGRSAAVLSAELVFSRHQPASPLWIERWQAAWAHVVSRHAVLRTLFLLDAGAAPCQVVRQQVLTTWSWHDMRASSPPEEESTLQALRTAMRQEPFDLTRPPLARGALALASTGAVQVILAFHPLILDRDSAAIVLSELLGTHATLMAGAIACDVPAAARFRDHVATASLPDHAASRAWWAERVNELPAPVRSTNPSESRTLGEQHIDITVPSLPYSLANVASRERVSTASLLTAMWARVLERRRASPVGLAMELSTRPSLSKEQVMLGPFTRWAPQVLRLRRDTPVLELARRIEEDRELAQRHALCALAPLGDDAWLVSAVAGPGPSLEAPEGVEVLNTQRITGPVPAPMLLEMLDAQCSRIRLTGDGDCTAQDLGTLSADLQRELASLNGEERIVVRLPAEPAPTRRLPMQFSLFYFADAAADQGDGKYRLLLDSVRHADRHGFTAVWTPERHFHPNGGLYPNPSVLSAGLATMTEHVGLRAGSVVLPLHHTLRVAEEWSVVDNLSGGRIGLSFASGWIPNDFAFFPERYAHKREHMFTQLDELQRLWRGETITAHNGSGNEYPVSIFPRPVQPVLPVWITCSGDPSVVSRAAESRYNVLTAFITLSFDEVARLIAQYRRAISQASGGTERGHVTAMVHTYVGEDEAATRELVRPALTRFLASHVDLAKRAGPSARAPETDQLLVSLAFERYYRTASLIGTPARCAAMVERFQTMGIDELACLIDFGLPAETVLAGLRRLDDLRDRFARPAVGRA